MKILVFGGSGKIGKAVAWDLVQRADVETVGLIGRRKDALEATSNWLKSGKARIHAVDIVNKQQTIPVLKEYDVGVIALPDRKTSYRIVDAAIEAGLHIVDMLEEYHRRPDAYEIEGLELPMGMTLNAYGDRLHERAQQQDVTFMDGIGFAPGLSNVTVGEAIRKLDAVESVIARVGGIPSKESAQRHPLRYMITWAFQHVLREYMVKLNILKGGKVVEVNALTDRERFRFNRLGVNEELECAVTPGMPSFIFTRPQLREFAEKTIRWPGHYQAIDALKECGLLNLDPVQHNGNKIVPREFLLTMIEPRLRQQPDDTDVCVMYNTVVGTKGGKKTRIEYFMWDEADTQLNMSSMARVTGFPSAIGAWLIGKGMITKRGIVPPEDCIEGKAYTVFMDEVKKRGINILEEETTL
jgi:lysine 6-dehydrogenase